MLVYCALIHWKAFAQILREQSLNEGVEKEVDRRDQEHAQVPSSGCGRDLKIIDEVECVKHEKCLKRPEWEGKEVADGADNISLVPLSRYQLGILYNVNRGIALNSGLLNQDCDVDAHICDQARDRDNGQKHFDNYDTVKHFWGKWGFLTEAVVE